MRLLFIMDKNNYDNCTKKFIRNSARSIIIKNHKIAMIHSLKYDYYKFPGGGIEKNENPIDALIRETKEEAGLLINRIKEYGYVHRIEKSIKDDDECFIQDNFYYFCDVEKERFSQNLDQYEAAENFQLEYVDPEFAINKNRAVNNSPYDQVMFEREAKVLKLLLDEGYIK